MRHTRTNQIICTSAVLLCFCHGLISLAAESKPNSGPVTAILGAFEREVTLIEDRVTQRRERIIEGIRFISGKLNDRQVVVTWTGVGKVNAAMTTTLLIEHFKPKRIIFTGIAGGVNRDLQPGDIVIAERTAHHDMGTVWPEGLFFKGVKSRIGGYENPVFFPADKELVKLAQRAADGAMLESIRTLKGRRDPKIIKGVVVTGDAFIASADKCAELRKRLEADAVEMEGAAVAQICYQRQIPCLVIRSISDNADEGAVMDKQMFYIMAARNSASLVAEMVGLLGEESSIQKGAGTDESGN
ncbi:MAG: 5'-methylthioadenosine/S-adenosylhomocysteine nucleosidase [Planctomycetes bacterium B3_Pla]|nr:MAG: 5'-methylthioadenosine/S-adenosylhomocysteine nucleosidase [Planctomycetes bacterium B3_Pla]